jgi:hypothetical protein
VAVVDGRRNTYLQTVVVARLKMFFVVVASWRCGARKKKNREQTDKGRKAKGKENILQDLQATIVPVPVGLLFRLELVTTRTATEIFLHKSDPHIQMIHKERANQP